jgi:hypothetical protein
MTFFLGQSLNPNPNSPIGFGSGPLSLENIVPGVLAPANAKLLKEAAAWPAEELTRRSWRKTRSHSC